MQRKWTLAAAVVVAAGPWASAAEAGVRVGVRVGPRPRVVAVSRPVVVRTPVLRVWAGPRIAAAPGFGQLQVEVEPDRAQVFIDGDNEGRGDTVETLRAGKHTVRVRTADGREAAQTVHVTAGHRTIVKLEL